MTPSPFVSAPRTALVLFLFASVVTGQEPATTTKTPRPLLALPDVKSAAEPSPALVPPVLPLDVASPPHAVVAEAPGTPVAPLACAPVDRARVHFDEPGDGETWARGASYKAGFGRGGAVYVPFFGSHAQASHPIALTVESVALDGQELAFERAASPRRAGAAVLFDRGAFVERYDLAPETVEQSFVFARLPARGELVLRIGVASDLGFEAADGGFEFAHELGRVTYGRATAIDGAGERALLESRRAGAVIEIRVPSSFVDAAVLPLTIDPVISTFAVDTTGTSNWLPKVAYDVTTDRYLVVHEERFSITDNDVFATVLSGSGASLGGNYVDASVTNWRTPDVANNNLSDQFLVVCTVGAEGADRSIRGRTWAAATSAQGSAFTISDGYFGDKHQPRVGGDPTLSAPTYYCVAWIRELGDGDVHYRIVRTDGTLVGPSTQLVDNTSGDDVNLDVSKSNGGEPFATQVWNVAWQRFFGTGISDLRGAQIAWDGVLVTPSFAIDSSANNDYYPSASSPHDSATGVRDWIVAFSRPVGADYDTLIRFLRGSLPVGAIVDLSALESNAGSGTLDHDQVRPSADCDGSRYAVAYEESLLGGQRNTYVATLDVVDSTVYLKEGHRALGTSSITDEYVDVTSRHGAGPTNGTFMAVWARLGPTTFDVLGGLYSTPPFQAFCFPGHGADCPCGNLPDSPGSGCNNSADTGGALLSGSGAASLAADSVLLVSTGELPNALSIFTQGDAFANAVFGQGRRCVGGSLKRLYTKPASGGWVSAPSGSDVSVSARSAALGDPIPAGSARYYYVYYRDPVVLGDCPSTSTFNATQALQAMWSP